MSPEAQHLSPGVRGFGGQGRCRRPPASGLCTLSLEFGRKQGSTKEEQERRRLIHKHKREFKGAVREIRKDSQLLARTRLSEIRSGKQGGRSLQP